MSPTQTQGTFQIHYFSTASSYTNKQTETLPAPLPLALLFETLETRYPGIREKVLCSCGVSLGEDYVDVEEEEGKWKNIKSEQDRKEWEAEPGDIVVIRPGDEVAIIPPVSSG